ncbi:hypothetical protein [Ferrigenium kumadai]|uniref:hypothetical protein n=1 Tax=Ferrigenium kumadai TaxID=1682490 RepID=UPI001BB36BBA|nr:hypothetical protein [Ferrigenium kumadai]
MVITSATSPSIFQPGFFAISGVQPVDLLINTPATTSASNVDIVDISALGQLLSAASIFESGILQSTATSPSGFTSLATATQLFVDAFNSFLQSGSGNLQNPPGLSLGNLFAQALLSQSSGNGTSIIASLSSVGINFVPPLTPNDAGRLTIDFQSLQSAFNANPTGTTTLLVQAIQSIGQQAVAFSSTAVQLENLTQIDTSLNSVITAATSGELATTTAGTTAPLVTISTVQTTTGLLSTTETATTTASIATQTATGLPTTTTPLAVTTTPVTTVLPTATVQPPTTGLPTTTEALATQTATELPTTTTPSVATTPVAATATATTVTTEPTVTAQLPTTVPPTTTASTATQTATELPTATPQIATPLAVTTTTATTALPAATTQLPAAGLPATAIATPAATEVPITTTPATTPAVSALPTTPLTTPPTTPNVTPTTLINRVVDASDPTIAAAIMAYHLIDGIIDTGARHYTRPPAAFTGRDEVQRVESTHPAKLDLYA